MGNYMLRFNATVIQLIDTTELDHWYKAVNVVTKR